MPFATLLTAILTTFAGRLLMALGISIVTYTGFDLLQQKFIDLAMNSLGSVSVSALQLFWIAGGGVALNWLCGAFAFVGTWSSVSRIASIFGGK